MRMDSDLAPTVLYPLTLPALLNHILTSQSSTTASTALIICSDRDTFLQALVHSLQKQDSRHVADDLLQLIAPTLHNLVTARHVNVAFCASVQALLAYLTAYVGFDSGASNGGKKEKETLVLVNPLSLHAPTPSFSAQGLSRTFAAATEAASRVGAKLVLVECLGMQRRGDYHDEENESEAAMSDGEEDTHVEVDENPWEQEVPILNVSVRRFGSAGGERSWAGRSVKVNRIAGRWFHFQNVRMDDG